METITQWIEQNLAIAPAMQTKVLTSLIVVLLLWILHLVVAKLIVLRVRDVYIRYRIRKTVGYIVFIIGFLVIGRIWIRGRSGG